MISRMSTTLRKPMSLAEFLAWEERQELRFEFDGFAPVAMNGGTINHERIGDTLRFLLRDSLRGKRCRHWGPTLKIEVAGRIRYPDAFVTCTPMAGRTTVATEPVVVFEVMSPSTSRTDRIEKLREYQATPSIQRYVILEQESIAASVFVRAGDIWAAHVLTKDDTLDMPEIEVSIPLAEIYAEVELTELLVD